MKRSDSTIFLTLFSLLISSCSNSLSTVQIENTDNFSNIEYSFSNKALSQNYLSRKFNHFLNPLKEDKILKELKFGQYKNPELVKDVINMNPGLLDLISPLNSVSSFRETSPSFDIFMQYLEQPHNFINTFAGNGFIESEFSPYSRTIGGYNGDNLPAPETSFNQPWEMTFDKNGNIFISDYLNYRIRRIDKNTNLVTTIAGDGNQGDTGDGEPAINSEINRPGPLTFDHAGNLYFIEEHGHFVRKISAINGDITSESIISTIAGSGYPGFDGDGLNASESVFSYPWGIAFDRSGNLYVSDSGNHRVRKISAVNGIVGASSIVNTIAGTGEPVFNGDGKTGTESSLYNPYDLAFDKTGNLYISDSLNHRIRKLSAINGSITSESILTTFAGSDVQGDNGDDGPATIASLGETGGIYLDNFDRLLLVDFSNQKVKFVDERGIIHTLAGDGAHNPDDPYVGSFGGDGGPATEASFYQPWGISVDNLGNIYVCDTSNHRIRKINK
jgi:sugar lactone lactonase YvrE